MFLHFNIYIFYYYVQQSTDANADISWLALKTNDLLKKKIFYFREAFKIEKKKCDNYHTLGLTPPPQECDNLQPIFFKLLAS